MEILILIRYVSILDWNKLEDSILRNPLFVWCIKVYKCVINFEQLLIRPQNDYADGAIFPDDLVGEMQLVTESYAS